MADNKKINSNNYIDNNKNISYNIPNKYIFIIKNDKKIKKIEQLNYFTNTNQFTQEQKIINIKSNAIKRIFNELTYNNITNDKLNIHNDHTTPSLSNKKTNLILYSKFDSNIDQNSSLLNNDVSSDLTKIQDEVTNFYNENGFFKDSSISKNYQKNNVDDKTYKIELTQFLEKIPISTLQKGPFQIFKSKITTEIRLQGKYFEKTMLFYFLYRNLNEQQREIYQTFWKMLINSELENKLPLSLPFMETTKNLLDNTSSINTNAQYNNILEVDSEEIIYRSKIISHNPPLVSYKEGIINKSKSIKKTVLVKLKTVEKNSTNTFILNPTKNVSKNKFFYNTPYLIWLDSMINQFVRRFSSNEVIKDIEIEKIIFQLALNMGKKWTEMTMPQKSEWVRKIKNDYKNNKKLNKETRIDQLDTSFNSNDKLNIN